MVRLLVIICFFVGISGAAAKADFDSPNGCAEFYDAAQGDRGASDVYISVQNADGNAGCFLVPRSVTVRWGRKYYIDGGLIDTVGLEPVDLQRYLSAVADLAVGGRQRAVAPEIWNCLDQPLPIFIGIFSGSLDTHTALSRLPAMNKLSADIRGYARYQQPGWGADYYIADDQGREVRSFECGPGGGKEECSIHGEYDRLKIGIMYRKTDMDQVNPEQALQCVRAIGDLFRVK